LPPKFICVLVLAVLYVLTGCGKEGYPEPPSLNLPLPPKDLRANRKAEKVTLSWTQPRMTTDQAIASKIGQTKICRNIGVDATAPVKSCEHSVGEAAPHLPVSSDSPNVTSTYTDELPQDVLNSNPAGFAVYAVEADSRNGRGGGLSNQIAVPLAPTLPPPTDLKAEVRADGVYLTAKASVSPANSRLRFGYRITRASVPAQPKEAPVTIAQVAAGASLAATDTTVDWEQHYKYTVTPYTELLAQDGGKKIAQVDGSDSAPLEVFTRDIFPPAVPAGLQAVYSNLANQRYIDLTWSPDTENDLAGYNIYRQSPDGSWRRLNNEFAKTPAYRDNDVAAGQTYIYSVTAVDLRNNESAKSAPAGETVPAQ
jgi:predicted small lipoprotein YifL